jgi:hypothetical protein
MSSSGATDPESESHLSAKIAQCAAAIALIRRQNSPFDRWLSVAATAARWWPWIATNETKSRARVLTHHQCSEALQHEDRDTIRAICRRASRSGSGGSVNRCICCVTSSVSVTRHAPVRRKIIARTARGDVATGQLLYKSTLSVFGARAKSGYSAGSTCFTKRE